MTGTIRVQGSAWYADPRMGSCMGLLTSGVGPSGSVLKGPPVQ